MSRYNKVKRIKTLSIPLKYLTTQLIKKSLSFETNKEKSIVDGKVISVDKENVVIDVGLKSEGRIPISEFIRPGQSPEINIGDNYKVYIDRVDGRNGETKLSREKAVKQATAATVTMVRDTNGKNLEI